MDEKELDKKLRENVEPGTESLAINEAQTQANQLLTERRMNLESEKSKESQEAIHDTELRGAIELGAMDGSGNQQVQAFPPQSAGLRPETQQLLAQYGVNPTITESSRRSNNVSQSRSSNTRSQTIPNQQGGQTRITNTTNITNITNNTTTNDTDIKGNFGNSPQVTPAPIFAPIKSEDNTGKFRTYLNNLFAKRDQERQLQEREFRKREWSLKRMNEKVLQRMESISNTFAKKMNPENIGRTFGGQLKTILAMAGLLILPKIWPSIKNGINSIGEFLGEIKESFTSTRGGFFDKMGSVMSTVGEKIVNGLFNIAGHIVGAIKGAAPAISQKLAQMIMGDEWESGMGLPDALSDKLKEWIGGAEAKAKSLAEVIGDKFDEIKDRFIEYIDTILEDRKYAVKKAIGDVNLLSAFDIKGLVKKFITVVGAALGGTEYLANNEFSEANSKADERISKGIGSEDKNWLGDINTSSGAEKMISNMAASSRSSDMSGASDITQGIRQLYEYSRSSDDGSIKVTSKDIGDIIRRTSRDENDFNDRWSTIQSAIRNGIIKIVPDDKLGRKLLITKEYVPTFLGIIGRVGDGLTFDKDKLEMNNRMMKELFKSKNFRNYQLSIDNIATGHMKGSYNYGTAFTNAAKFTWNNLFPPAIFGFGRFKYGDTFTDASEKASYSRYNEAKNIADEHNESIDKKKTELIKSTGIDKASDKIKEKSEEMKSYMERKKDEEFYPQMMSTHNAVVNYTGIGAVMKPYMSSENTEFMSNPVNESSIADVSVPIIVNPESRGQWVEDQMNSKVVSGVSSGDRLTKDQFEARVRRAMTYLIHTLGLTPTQAAGLVGNFIRESRLLTSAFNGAGGGMGARGIAQWRGSRIESFRSVNGKDVLDGSFEEQLRHVASELQSTHKSALTELKQVAEGDTAKAADIGLGRFEFSAGLNKAVEALGKHGPSSRDSGRAFAEDALNIYNSKGDFLNPINAVDDSSGVSVDNLGLSTSSSSTSASTQSSSNDSEGMLSSLWSNFKGAVNNLFGNGSEGTEPTESAPITPSINMTPKSSTLPSELTVDSSTAVTPLSEPIQFEPVTSARNIQEYIENKEDAIAEEEKAAQESTTPVIMDNSHNVGPTNINTTNNTTVLVNRTKESFIESMNIKSRNY